MAALPGTGARLRKVMKKRGFTPAMLAQHTEISLTTINYFLDDKRDMHLDDLRKIGKVLQVNPSVIAWGK